ncbi:MAG: ABC transporter permease [Granulosicoccus sp.]
MSLWGTRMPLGATIAAIGLVCFVVVAVFAPVFAPHDPNKQDLFARLKPPATEVRGNTYSLGTDELGRDVTSRIIYGARVSLLVAFVSVCVSMLVGTALGIMAGYYRGWVDIVIMRTVDIVLSIPALLLAIIAVIVLQPGLLTLIAVLGFTRWPRYTRVAYGQTLGVVHKPYVTAARFYGAKPWWQMSRHVLPNILNPLIVVATLEFGLMILFEAGLSFLGLGIQPPSASWGAMMSVGRNYLNTAWWIATYPGLCLFLLVLCVNMLGDHLRDRLDPHEGR